MRGMASALPPGGKGTITRIGREGYSPGRPCAAAGMFEIALDIAQRTTISLTISTALLMQGGYSIARIPSYVFTRLSSVAFHPIPQLARRRADAHPVLGLPGRGHLRERAGAHLSRRDVDLSWARGG